VAKYKCGKDILNQRQRHLKERIFSTAHRVVVSASEPASFPRQKYSTYPSTQTTTLAYAGNSSGPTPAKPIAGTALILLDTKPPLRSSGRGQPTTNYHAYPVAIRYAEQVPPPPCTAKRTQLTPTAIQRSA